MIYANRSPLDSIIMAVVMVTLFWGAGTLWRLINRKKKQKEVPDADSINNEVYNNDHSTTSMEERFYGIAATEIKTGNIVAGIMAKAISDSDGDNKRTFARYMKFRVDQMKKEINIAVYPQGWKPVTVVFGLLCMGFFGFGDALFYGSITSVIAGFLPAPFLFPIICVEFILSLIIIYFTGYMAILLLKETPSLTINNGTVQIHLPQKSTFQLDEIEEMRVVTEYRVRTLLFKLKNGKTLSFPELWSSLPLEQLEQELIKRLTYSGVEGTEVKDT